MYQAVKIKKPRAEFVVEKKCATCGKVFVPAPHHVFTKGGKWYCKWTCYNKGVNQ